MSHSINRVGSHSTQPPITIESDVSVRDALELMRAWGIRHFPVVEGEELVGVVSERDLFLQLAVQREKAPTVAAAMTSPAYVVARSTPLAIVARTMAERKIGCAVVADLDSNIAGIFTTTDALFVLARILADPDDESLYALRMEDYFREGFRVAAS